MDLARWFADSRTAVGLASGLVLVFAGVLWRVTDREALSAPGGIASEPGPAWAWLSANRASIHGRVFVQDTWVGPEARRRALDVSHVFALTSWRTGIQQIGAYYSMMPFASQAWTRADGGRVFGELPGRPTLVDDASKWMARANVTHLMLVEPRAIARFASDPRFHLEYHDRSIAILSLRGRTAAWGRPVSDDAEVTIERHEPGRFTVTVDRPGETVAPIAIAESYHSFWRVQPPSAATIGVGAGGLMLVWPRSQLVRSFELVYEEPPMPRIVSALGGVAIVCLLLACWVVGLTDRRSRILSPTRPERLLTRHAE